MPSFPNSRFRFRKSGPAWYYWWLGQENNKFQDPLLSAGPDGQPFQSGVIYEAYSQVTGGDAELHTFYFDALGVPQSASAGSAPPNLPTTPGSGTGTPSWQKTLEINPEVTISPIAPYYQWSQELPAVSNADSLVRDYFHPVLQKWVLVKINLALLANQLIGLFDPQMLYNRIKDLIPTGTGGGFFGFTNEDWDKIWLSTYQYIANKEGWQFNGIIPPAPAYPTLSGGGGGTNPGTAVINANLSKYEDNGAGLTIQANCSNGENFMGQVLGVNGAAVPDSTWHLLSRIGGNAANGTYAFPYANLPTSGILDPGNYVANVRIGVDNATIVPKPFTVENNVPYPLPGTENLKWVGPMAITAGQQNVEFRIDNRYNNGTYQPYSGNIVFYPLNAPPGVAFASATEISTGLVKGYFSSDTNAVSVATKITLVAYVGAVNIYFEITLQPAAQTVKAINGLYVVDVNPPTNDHDIYANVTQAAEVIRAIYQVVNGVEQLILSDTTWSALTPIPTEDNPTGEYRNSGTPVKRYYGLPPASLGSGNYNVYYTARPAGNSNANTYVKHAPVAITINRGTTQPGPWRYSQVTAPAVLAIDYRWFKRVSPERPDLYLYLKVSTTDSYEIAAQVTSGSSVLPKSAYSSLQVGDYGNAYTQFTTYGNAVTGSVYKLYIRKVGTTTDLLIIDSPAMPASDLPRTNFYTKP